MSKVNNYELYCLLKMLRKDIRWTVYDCTNLDKGFSNEEEVWCGVAERDGFILVLTDTIPSGIRNKVVVSGSSIKADYTINNKTHIPISIDNNLVNYKEAINDLFKQSNTENRYGISRILERMIHRDILLLSGFNSMDIPRRIMHIETIRLLLVKYYAIKSYNSKLTNSNNFYNENDIVYAIPPYTPNPIDMAYHLEFKGIFYDYGNSLMCNLKSNELSSDTDTICYNFLNRINSIIDNATLKEWEIDNLRMDSNYGDYLIANMRWNRKSVNSSYKERYLVNDKNIKFDVGELFLLSTNPITRMHEDENTTLYKIVNIDYDSRILTLCKYNEHLDYITNYSMEISYEELYESILDSKVKLVKYETRPVQFPVVQ